MDGDANTDGSVDGDDFLIWQTQFGSGGDGSGTVPEPSAIAVLALAATSRSPSFGDVEITKAPGRSEP